MRSYPTDALSKGNPIQRKSYPKDALSKGGSSHNSPSFSPPRALRPRRRANRALLSPLPSSPLLFHPLSSSLLYNKEPKIMPYSRKAKKEEKSLANVK